LSLSWARPVQSIPPHSLSPISILILSIHIHLVCSLAYSYKYLRDLKPWYQPTRLNTVITTGDHTIHFLWHESLKMFLFNHSVQFLHLSHACTCIYFPKWWNFQLMLEDHCLLESFHSSVN
jgi:hypothetical protein